MLSENQLRNGLCFSVRQSSYQLCMTREVGRALVREAFEWHETSPSASLTSRVLSQLPKCIHNSIDAQLNHGPFLLEHCHFQFTQHL